MTPREQTRRHNKLIRSYQLLDSIFGKGFAIDMFSKDGSACIAKNTDGKYLVAGFNIYTKRDSRRIKRFKKRHMFFKTK